MPRKARSKKTPKARRIRPTKLEASGRSES
jgi:hypothetical protein